MTFEVELLTKRVVRLERENRFFKLVGAAVTLGAIALVSIGAVRTPRTLEAEKIVLLDSHGHARVTISTPAFSGVAFDMKPDQPAIWLSDDKGSDRAILTTDGLYFANSKVRPTISLNSDSSSGVPTLKVYDPDGKVRWTTP